MNQRISVFVFHTCRFFLCALFFVLILTSLVGCSLLPQISNEAGSAFSSSTTSEPSTEITESPRIIPFFTTESDPAQLAALQTIIQEYQALHPDVEVDIVLASPASRGRRLLTSLASGADLGIFEIEPTLMPEWVDSGYLLPLDDVANAIGENDFVPGSLFRANNHVYALPYATSVYGLWVRKDLFEQAGLALPSTYDEVLTAARKLTHAGMYGIALPAGQNIATVNYFSTFLWQNGTDYFSCDGKVVFGQPQALEAVKRWSELTKFAPPGFTTWDYSEQIDAFLSGQVAMTMYGGRLGVQLASTHPELEDKVTVIFPPWGKEKVTLGVWSRFAIASGTKNQADAKDFLRFLVSGNQLLLYDMTLPGHMIPSLESVRKLALQDSSSYTLKHKDWINSFYEWSQYINHPAMNMGSMSDGHFLRSEVVPPWARELFGTPGIIDSMLQDIAMGNRSPEEGWQIATTRMQQSIDEWKSSHPTWVGKCAP